MLYDFDFSEWIAHPPREILLGEDFAVDLPLFWIKNGVSLSNLGRLEMTYAESGEHRGNQFHYYHAGGTALGSDRGEFWFAEDGRLLDAVMPIPNHSEYRDLRLRLIDTTRGEQAWRALLARHWEGCD
ncbi:hypothetical protein [Qipengyuania sphaerica]|uniref:hypothetical protein n=1 Tax=Qipengyuania sphaerica TaxID=2867243 RepID=UPI001C87CD34|nr:hypothetical protein [Qipengyuania sphaerica]MBX7541624.1 hypothetical protein [Qipengyuania sphaerica]